MIIDFHLVKNELGVV